MDELVRWLGEQLAEDERIAREAGGADWMPLTVPRFSSPGDRGEVEIGDAIVTVPTPDVALHIAAYDPARVLREIDAKRKIVTEATEYEPGITGFPEMWTTLRLLALPYADRPGYREEWRPKPPSSPRPGRRAPTHPAAAHTAPGWAPTASHPSPATGHGSPPARPQPSARDPKTGERGS